MEELQASRQRIIEVATEERRRLERNLHDGAQHRLLALECHVATSEQSDIDHENALDIIREAKSELGTILDELVDLARGIHPTILTQLGLSCRKVVMPLPASELRELVTRLADRRAGRTEANVQSDLHMLLAAGPLDLGDDKLQDIVLESPAGQRRRIDVETGFTVFEVKRDLRTGKVRQDAVIQLAGYVASRAEAMQQRYVGVLTDGAEWHLYSLAGDELALVSSLEVDPKSPDVDGLCLWLEGVLATTEKITPTPREITARLGADSPAHALDISDLTVLYQAHKALPTVRLKRELWAKLLTTALGTAFSDDDRLFIEHTLLVTTAKIIAHAVVGIDPADPSVSPAVLARGGLFAQAQITGVVDQDFFDWVVEVAGGQQWVRTLARRLARFAWGQVEHDVMKVLYESVISTSERHRLGEYYTPDWLAEEMVSQVVTEPLTQRVLDPGCGSGTFLFHAVRHYLRAAAAAGTANADAILRRHQPRHRGGRAPGGRNLRPGHLPARDRHGPPPGRRPAADRRPGVPRRQRPVGPRRDTDARRRAEHPHRRRIPPLGRRPAVPGAAARRRRPVRPARLGTRRPGRRPGTAARLSPRSPPCSGAMPSTPTTRRSSRRPSRSCAACTTRAATTSGATTSATSLGPSGWRSPRTAWTC